MRIASASSGRKRLRKCIQCSSKHRDMQGRSGFGRVDCKVQTRSGRVAAGRSYESRKVIEKPRCNTFDLLSVFESKI